ncbi:TetR/AcrR family transcriptional regulator [Streptococcus loxodontisalivarius]|uniref:AcrR family transcriptional regulator n=1 Tax=Streptococcus loxodontisalivarius TaxID=1349415 RepID=A0ABS2PQ20_9STRE|nr:TetR family transcriptional regulator [Streptococcus loxodontisalivarius]MBM7642133.1 AcrR family transcriptional regulator [Streptococcus loxodontisalivarius]
MTYARSISEQKISAALVSLLNEKEFDYLTIQDITEVAGVSRATFYNHFSNKENMVEVIAAQLLDDISVILMQDSQLEEGVISQALTYIKENYTLIRSLIDHFSTSEATIKKYISEIILHSEVDLKQKFQDHYDMQEKFAFEIYITTIYSLIITWIKTGAKESPEEMARTIKHPISHH